VIHTLGNWRRDGEKSFLIEILQPIRVEGMIKLKYHHFATLNEIMALGIDDHWLLSLKEIFPDVMWILVKEYHTTYETILPKTSCLYLI
jgi:hypothetical protein